MKKTHISSLALFILFSCVFNNIAMSWDNKVTHKDLSEYAAESSVLSKTKGDYLRNFGFEQGVKEPLKWDATKTILDWLREGALLEDAGSKIQALMGKARFNNHFHNPLKSWAEAGLSDIQTGESSLKWAQDWSAQIKRIEGNWSWQKVREHFYTALTGRDFNNNVMASTQGQREEYFARTFRGLGHQMHLIQDVSQPDHVRNDAHPEDELLGKNPLNGIAYFETWTKKQFPTLAYLKALAPNPVFPNIPFNVSYNGLGPITQFVDTDRYDGLNASAGINQGLAEYTNSNFFSGDSIFAVERYSQDDKHYFPYPRKSSTDLQEYIAQIKPLLRQIAEDGIQDKGIWIKKERDGEIVNHLVRAGRWSGKIYKIFGEGSLFYDSFYRDEACYKDYASLLIPRAVGYSAGLLDYFFRGSIDIALPAAGVYAQTNNPAAGFAQIKLLVKNTTPNNEQMNNGTIELVVGYRLAIDDPFKNYSEDYPFRAEDEMTYIVVPEKNGVSSIPRDGSVELTFDLSQNPIPLWAINVLIRVVYHGQLGNESGAVAVGFKDISEPTPIDFFNDMDQICMNGNMYLAGSPEAIAQGDTNNDGILDWDIYPHDASDIYYRTSPADRPQYASDTNYNVTVPYLQAGQYVRASYILTDYTFSYNTFDTLIGTVQDDPWYNTSRLSELYTGIAIKNQLEYEESAEVCAPMSAPCHIWWYPTFQTYRGANLWGGAAIIFINKAYPEGSKCSCYQGVSRDCMTGTQVLKKTDTMGEDVLPKVRRGIDMQIQPAFDSRRRIVGR